MVRLVVVVIAATALLAAPAAAATRVIIKGGGWGHGIGMSQYGAYGRATRGDSAEQILEHYYSGASVTKRDQGQIRVGLLQGQTIVRVDPVKAGDNGGLIVFKEEGVSGRLTKGRPGDTFRVEPSGTGGMRIYKNGNRVKSNGRRVFGTPQTAVLVRFEKQNSMVRVEDKNTSYRYGRLEFSTYQSSSCGSGFCLRLVVQLSMQKYLYGLGEVPSSWPQAALRTQAIAGRTYAFEKIKRLGQNRTPCACAVYDSTIDQAYIGDSKRTGSGSYWDDWKEAVNQTKGQIILHNGDPIQALYSSSSGGHTEHNENVWGGTPLPYLRGVSDGPDDNSANPNHEWRVTMRWSELENKMQSAYSIGELERFRLMKPFGVSGRVTVVKSSDRGGVKIVGSKNTVRKDGWDIRSVLALKDTLFKITYDTSTNRNMRGAYTAIGERPGAPVEPAYHRYDVGGDVLGLVQHFERGRMKWDAATGVVTWKWRKNFAEWHPGGELVVDGPAFDTAGSDCSNDSCS